MKSLAGSCLLIALASTGAPVLADDGDAPDCSNGGYLLNDAAACDGSDLHQARARHTATLLADGRVLVAGGVVATDRGGEIDGTSTEIYDPSTGKWTLAAPLHVARSMHTATLLADGRVLVLGGHFTFAGSSSQVWSIDDTGEIYDPLTDAWTPIDGPFTPRDGFTATLLPDGKVLVAGGIGEDDRALGTCELYDPVADKWTMTGSFPVRWWHRATALADGRVLVTGGYEDDDTMLSLAGAQIYDAATGRWTAAGTMSMGRGWHQASLLADGRVMVTGGETKADWDRTVGTFPLSEIYDPLADVWLPGPDLGAGRLAHSATLLRDGSLLVAAGLMETGQTPHLGAVVLGEVEDSPATAAPWAAVASLGTPRYDHTATLLRDGTVLFAGGYGSVNGGLLTAVEIMRPPNASAP